MISVVRSERVRRPAHDSNQWSRIWDWFVSRRNRALAMERLSDHMLRDIGVHRRYRFQRDQQVR